MDPIIQTVLTNIIPVFLAAVYMARKIESLGERMKNVEIRLQHLDEKREIIALIPGIHDRLRRVEDALFGRHNGTE